MPLAFRSIRELFELQLTGVAERRTDDEVEHAYRLATAALLVEMTRADFEVQHVERAAVADAIQRAFDLGPGETAELMRLAEREADAATSLYQFTRLINDHLSDAEKRHVIELLWRVAFADGEVDRYEDHLVRKIADLIHVPHRAFIQAKIKVQREVGQSPHSSPTTSK